MCAIYDLCSLDVVLKHTVSVKFSVIVRNAGVNIDLILVCAITYYCYFAQRFFHILLHIRLFLSSLVGGCFFKELVCLLQYLKMCRKSDIAKDSEAVQFFWLPFSEHINAQ